MAKHTIKGWIAVSVPDEFGSDQHVTFLGYKPSGECYVPVREHSFEAEIDDDFDPRPAMLAALDKKEAEIRADFAKSITDLQEQRNKLLALEMA